MNIYSNSPLFKIHDGIKLSSFIQPQIQNYIIVDQYDVQENRALLDKIVSALNLKWDSSVALIELDIQKKNEFMLMDFHHIKALSARIVIFGIPEKQLKMQYQMKVHRQLLIENTSIHYTHSLRTLKEDVKHKKELWNYLKSASWGN